VALTRARRKFEGPGAGWNGALIRNMVLLNAVELSSWQRDKF